MYECKRSRIFHRFQLLVMFDRCLSQSSYVSNKSNHLVFLYCARAILVEFDEALFKLLIAHSLAPCVHVA